jgi:hypothetical protein
VRARKHRLSFVVGLAFIAYAHIATAAPSEGEQLFREGRAAMQEKDYDRACSKFAESQAKEPAPGTALNLGECEEHRGHLVAAYDAFSTAASTFTASEKQKYASSRAEALERRISRLVIHATSPVAGLTARIGTTPVPVGTEVKMDPGDVVIHAEAPGFKAKELRATLREGRTLDLDVGVLERVAAQPAENERVNAPVVIAPPDKTRGSDEMQRTIGLVVGGVGAAALVVGGVTGVMALDRASTVEDHCDENLACDAEGFDAAQSGDTLSLVSTITVAGGAAALVGGAVLYFTAKRSKSTALAPTASRNGFGLMFGGRF